MRILALLLSLLLALPAWSDITVVNSDDDVQTGTSFSVGAGENRAVIWGLGSRDNVDNDLQTGASYNGTAMVTDGIQNVGGQYTSGLYRALEANLPASSGTLTASFEGDGPVTNEGMAITIAGYDQQDPIDSATVSAAGASSWSFPDIEVVEGGIVIIHMVSNGGMSTANDCTEISETATPPNSSLFYCLIDADGTVTYTISDTSPTGTSAGTLISLAPAESEPEPNSILLLRQHRDDDGGY